MKLSGLSKKKFKRPSHEPDTAAELQMNGVNLRLCEPQVFFCHSYLVLHFQFEQSALTISDTYSMIILILFLCKEKNFRSIDDRFHTL